MSDLVRPAGDRDPEGVGEYISTFSSELLPGSSVALRELWYHLRASGTAATDDLRTLAWEVDSVRGHHANAGEWWRSCGKTYFPLLPSVVPPEGDAVEALDIDLSGSDLAYLEEPYRPVEVDGHE